MKKISQFRLKCQKFPKAKGPRPLPKKVEKIPIGGGGGGSRTSIKREKDTMTKEVLDHLLRDDVSNINSGGGGGLGDQEPA